MNELKREKQSTIHFPRENNSDPLIYTFSQLTDQSQSEDDISNSSLTDERSFDDQSASDFASPTSSPSCISRNSSFSASSSSYKHKYLYPETDSVEELRPEEVRWFYKEEGDKKYTPFIGYDSLRIECKYRELLHTADERLNQDTNGDERIVVRGSLYEVDVYKCECHPIYWSSVGKTTTVLRGTWFIAGTWQPLDKSNAEQIEKEHLLKFADQKLEDDDQESPKGIQAVIHNIKFKQFHVDWNSVNKVYMHSEATSSKFYRAVGTKLGLAKSGTRLHRGYYYESCMDDKPPDISHLVFVIHGMGQKMETGSIVKSCGELRETSQKLRNFFPNLEKDNKRAEFLPVEWRSSLTLDGDTVESITPNKVKGLREMLNSSAMDILYYTSPLYRSEITQGLQTQLNRLYTMFCARHPYFEASGGLVSLIAHSLGCVITYDIITGWNPIQLYDQYVASVIDEWKDEAVKPCGAAKSSSIVGNKIYFTLSSSDLEEKSSKLECAGDIISELEDAREKVSELESKLLKLAEKQHLRTPTLRFKLQNLFCLGSPLAVFLALRGIRPMGDGKQDHILPRSLCSRLFNMYHPSDPVAYRLEPLILKHYATIKPLRVYRYDSPKKEPYESLPCRAYAAMPPKSSKKPQNNSAESQTDEKLPKKTDAGTLGAIFRWSRRGTDKLTAEMDVLDHIEKLSEADGEEDDWVSLEVSSDGTGDSIEHPDLEYRLDYQLREGKMENAYLAALTSHTSYWTNQDVALFVMTQIFPDYGPR